MRKIIFLASVAAITLSYSVFAQQTANSPDILLTWSASSYTPSDYAGKALPTLLSEIKLAVEVSDNGRLADLSQMMIRWYVDGNFSARGVGLQTFGFPAKKYPGNTYTVRAVIPDYGAAGDLAQSVIIPIVDPEPVIRVPFAGNVITDNHFSLEGVPYFFNVSDPSILRYSWTLNNQLASSSGDARTLDVNLGDNVPDGAYLRAGLTITNPQSQIESGSSENIFLYKKQ